MDMYREAYEQYMQSCQNYEMESISFHRFISHLTEEQLHEYLNSVDVEYDEVY
ncbi:hypothetical protein [Bacillus thermotolerans]|uniref:Uncharacterized protein n=1 Tax=Bacillus thermotolerans TaxID=1221996 RepID=A0A0F5HVP9_BACTR|nr:hypothetical protein [Bacillus thermotolerans]KKB33824.1 hypothetical protein QY97_02973 [Bacillus thermotolerans]KKB37318.1 hypothetical protein QY95_02869 [Bacillus thermotolerans]KKB42136.1 hypothetical protein QY96_01513 [Bacillus thermotolerans]